jgi:GTP-binding protein
MEPSGDGMTRIEYLVPSRGLIGFRSEFLTDTRGTGVLYSVFDHYGDFKGEISSRQNGAMVVLESGVTTAYSLYALQERGQMFMHPGEEVYAGQVLGIHARENELVVNPCKKKALTNMRSAGADEKLILTPPRIHTLESALEWIEEDELVEVTPKSIRIRKVELDHNRRKRN